MKVLRKIGNITLNQGSGMANGLFNITNNEINLDGSFYQLPKVTLWFDADSKDELMAMNDDDFIAEANRLINLE